MDEFRAKAHKYILRERHLQSARASSSAAKMDLKRAQNQKIELKTRDRDDKRGFRGKFDTYTPLVTNLSKILDETLHADLATVQKPYPIKDRPGIDKTKFYTFHKSFGHNTDSCIQLKDAIEQLIREGKLQRYVQEKQTPV